MTGTIASNKVVGLYSEIVEKLRKISDPEIAERNKRWHKEPDYVSYGVRSSDLKQLLEQYRTTFEALSLRERIELARRFYSSRISTEAGVGNHLLELSQNGLDPSHLPVFDELLRDFTNWGTTDWFCIGVLQPLLSRFPAEVIGLLREWNRSENIWKRRASVVTFTRKTALSGEFIDVAIEFCDKLIFDKEDLVRKAVGWALKDNMRFDKARVLEYVKDLKRRGVSSTITLYAIRDLKGAEREEVLNIKSLGQI